MSSETASGGVGPVAPVSKASKTLTGGAYIPPAKLKMLQAAITDKQSIEFQRLSWEALKRVYTVWSTK